MDNGGLTEKDKLIDYLIKLENIRQRYPKIRIPYITDQPLEELEYLYNHTIQLINKKQKKKQIKEQKKQRNKDIISLYLYCIRKNNTFDTSLKDPEFHKLLGKLLPERVVNTITGNYKSVTGNYQSIDLPTWTINDCTAICQLILDFFTILYP